MTGAFNCFIESPFLYKQCKEIDLMKIDLIPHLSKHLLLLCLGEVSHLLLTEENYHILCTETLGCLGWIRGGRLTECLLFREYSSIRAWVLVTTSACGSITGSAAVSAGQGCSSLLSSRMTLWRSSTGSGSSSLSSRMMLQRSSTGSGSSSSVDSSLSKVLMGFAPVMFVGEVFIHFSARWSSLAMPLVASLGTYSTNSSVEVISASDKSEAGHLNCTHSVQSFCRS